MSLNLATKLLDQVDINLQNYVFNTYASLSSELSSTIKIVFILFWVFYGIAIIKGLIDFNIRDFLINVFKLTLIFVFITKWALFNEFVYTVFTYTPHQIGGVLLASNGFSAIGINGALDNILDRTIYVFGKLVFDTGWREYGIKIMGVIFSLIMVFMIIYALYLIILSKVAIALLLGLAPLFILLKVFKSTTGLFEGWIRQLINFFIIPIITYSLLVLVVQLLDSDLKAIEQIQLKGKLITSNNLYGIITIAGVSIGLLFQIMGIASGIAGGIQLADMSQSIKNNYHSMNKMNTKILSNIKTFTRKNTVSNR